VNILGFAILHGRVLQLAGALDLAAIYGVDLIGKGPKAREKNILKSWCNILAST